MACGWAACDRNDTAGVIFSSRRGGLVTQAGLDDSLAGKGWRRESIIAPGGSGGLEHQRISIKEVSVWGSGRGRRMVKVVGCWGGSSPHCPSSDWEQEERSGTALCLQLLWRRWLLGGFFCGQSLSVLEEDCEGRPFCSPWHFVLMLVKNKNENDTAGSYHITIVSFNKHFLKLYIFIMQGS